MPDLFDSLTVKSWTLPNRLVMAPLTRNRADGDGVPGELAVQYYAQRASAGLIITEGTQPSAVGQGYLNTPGLHSAEQVAGWRRVADAVHERGGRIVAQLMHAGRVSHPDNKHGLETVAPSAIAAPNEMFTADGMKPHPVPRALELDEIPAVVEEYVQAARNAVEAGLDGVEVHAANGYLIHQFLAPGSNHRADELRRVPGEPRPLRHRGHPRRRRGDRPGAGRDPDLAGPQHPGRDRDRRGRRRGNVRILVEAIAPLGLAYLSILADPRQDLVQRLRKDFGGVVIANDGFGEITTRETAQAILDEDLADAVAVGRLFLANPDLPRRWGPAPR